MKSQLQTIGGKVKMIPFVIAEVFLWFLLDAFITSTYSCPNCGAELARGKKYNCPACGEEP